jgi:hypothetical protein
MIEDNLCGIDGKDDETVTVGRFNRWVAFALKHHLLPMKGQVQEIAEYTRQEKLDHASIRGGIKVMLWTVPIFNVILLFVIYMMHKAGFL